MNKHPARRKRPAPRTPRVSPGCEDARRLVEESWRVPGPAGDVLACRIYEDGEGLHVCLLSGAQLVQTHRVRALDHARLLGRVWRTALVSIR